MLHKIHRISAIIIASYFIVHIANHLTGLAGIAAHIAFMEKARAVYRMTLVEILLLASVAIQIVSGIRFIIARWRQQRGFYDRLQVISGGYVAFFLMLHVSAVLIGRMTGLDTNFYFAAAGMHSGYLFLFFIPYYFFGVAAVFAHIACAFVWLSRDRLAKVTRHWIARALIGFGLLVAGVIVAVLAGWVYPVIIPVEYLQTYQR